MNFESKKSPISCNHANESPINCICDQDCYCKEHSCKNSRQVPFVIEADKQIAHDKEIMSLRCTVQEHKNTIDRLIDRNIVLREALDRKNKALLRYGHHDHEDYDCEITCDVHEHGPDTCTCGLTDAIKDTVK
jgi:hypothetical protein